MTLVSLNHCTSILTLRYESKLLSLRVKITKDVDRGDVRTRHTQSVHDILYFVIQPTERTLCLYR